MQDAAAGPSRLTFTRWAPFLFGSGLCGLVYQVAWFREFRLVFGGSTAATSAVLAVFIGGLGVGGLLLGRRADRHPSPFALYARLEMLVAVTAACTPWLLDLTRLLYVAVGGTPALGLGGGTAARLVLGAVVLAAPTLLMGGTLPAAARAVSADGDAGRRSVGLAYGVNTLGAVAGCLLATFVLLEILGTRRALLATAAVNLLIGVLAQGMARRASAPPAPAPIATPALSSGPALAPPTWFTLLAAGAVGFAFFLMEIVWYRMLAPVLGGSTYTFGLILAVALLGIGLGGACHALRAPSRPATVTAFAITCLLEALALAVPYALGDRIATLALSLRTLGTFGFYGLVASWAVITAIVVLPAAFIAGFQFPLLIGLLGRGRDQVGRQTGLAYACNTTGAIVGALAGGFGLLPALGAPGCWRAVAALLVALGLAGAVLGLRGAGAWRPAIPAAALAVAACLLLGAEGPTAVWRHSPIGVGRVNPDTLGSPNSLRSWMNAVRHATRWEAEGVESSVALQASRGLAFVINGKVDGNARSDAPTQVMGGLLGALIRPAPVQSALVIGLGTGSTAGWLGALPTIESVDVVELEPAIREVARASTPVNRSVLDNDKVHLTFGDAREWLLVARRRYDLIFSEPSNPYRAGIASLFTQEFYRAALERLADDGLFLQWVQAYEIDGTTVRTIYGTLTSVFPSVETWYLTPADLLLVASRAPVPHDPARLRARLGEEPFRSALALAWRVADLEGVLAHHAARPSFARAVAEADQREGGTPATDDLNHVEFGFARSVTFKDVFTTDEVLNAARRRGEHLPFLPPGALDVERLEDERILFTVAERGSAELGAWLTPEQRARAQAHQHLRDGNPAAALEAWRRQPRAPVSVPEIALLAEALADAGEEAALPYIERLRASQPAEADGIAGLLRMRQKRPAEAAELLARSLARYRSDPWPSYVPMGRVLQNAVQLARADRSQARRMFEALREPFALFGLERQRQSALLTLAFLDPAAFCAETFRQLEPFVPWSRPTLLLRTRCYGEGHPLAARARADLSAFDRYERQPFERGLGAAGSVPAPAIEP